MSAKIVNVSNNNRSSRHWPKQPPSFFFAFASIVNRARQDRLKLFGKKKVIAVSSNWDLGPSYCVANLQTKRSVKMNKNALNELCSITCFKIVVTAHPTQKNQQQILATHPPSQHAASQTQQSTIHYRPYANYPLSSWLNC